MTPNFLSPLLAIFLSFTTASLCTGQTISAQSSSDWQGLERLKRGKQILIEYKSSVGGTLECKLVSISGSKLTVVAGGYQATIDHADIQNVYRLHGKWSPGTTAKIGAGIGILVGSLVGAARAVDLEREPGHIPSDRDSFPALAGSVIGVAAGAGIGALLGGKRKGSLLYAAR